MFLDYIGQELIWRLTCNHPYQLNTVQTSIHIKCPTPKINGEIVSFITSHIPKEDIVKIIKMPTPFICGPAEVAKEIHIQTVFGGISTLYINNEDK